MENQIIYSYENQKEVSSDNQEKVKKYEQVEVMKVIDGNSFIASDGRIIRLVGVDTPECSKNKEKIERLAKMFTIEWLLGETVWLERDISDMDCYSRYLRIVWMEKPFDDRSLSEIEAQMFNVHILLEGYAKASAYPPDIKYQDLFSFAEAGARIEKRGIWGL